MKIFSLKAIGIAFFVLILSGCDSQFLYYKVDNEVRSALTNDKNPPTTARETNVKIDLGNWRLYVMSVSPNNDYLAFGFLNQDSGTNMRGKLEIYGKYGKVLKRTFTNEQLKKLIEDGADLMYPLDVYAFHPFALGYENNKVLIVHIQPYSTGLTPQNVELKINLETNKLVSAPLFFSRNQSRPFPAHASKNRFNFSVTDGEMFVNGNKLNGLPKNIDENLHDEVDNK